MSAATSLRWGKAAAAEAAADIRRRLGTERPVVGLILGSGLAGLSNRFEGARRVAYGDIPGFPVPSVVGHPGVLVSGHLAGRPAIALAGRFHMYEGHEAALAAFPVRVLHALGAEILFVSNAAGGIRRTFRPGDLMVIGDHMNLTGHNPLFGPVEQGERIPVFIQLDAPVGGTHFHLRSPERMVHAGGRVQPPGRRQEQCRSGGGGCDAPHRPPGHHGNVPCYTFGGLQAKMDICGHLSRENTPVKARRQFSHLRCQRGGDVLVLLHLSLAMTT